MSLLDDVSVVVTPNGYKAGTLYSVLPTAIAGSELVQDSNFTLTGTQAQNTAGTYWVTYAGWTISGGKALRSGVSGNSPIAQNVPVVNGKVYKFSYTRTYASGNGETNLFVQTDGSNYVTLGSYTSTVVEEHTVTGTFVAGFTGNIFWQLYGIGTFAGSVDNISVKEWSGADMEVTRATAATRVDENGLVNYTEVLGSEIANNNTIQNSNGGVISETSSLNYNVVSDGTAATQFLPRITFDGTTNGKTYKLVITPSNQSGDIDLKLYNGSSFEFQDNDMSSELVYYFTTNGTPFIAWAGQQTFSVDFTISLKESDKNNVPRIDYTGGGCPHILAEPQSTNLLIYSEDFNDSSWSHNADITVTNSSELAPNGKLDANLIEYDGSGYSFFRRSISATSTAATLSVFAKKGNWRYLGLRNFQTDGESHTVFDFDTETFANTASGQTASFEIFSNGWYRIKVTQPSPEASNFAGFAITNSSGSELNTTGSQVANIHLFGAQLEEKSYATSYIPTSGSTVTRNQDQFSRDGIASLINSAEGVLFVEMATLTSVVPLNNWLTITDGTASNQVALGFETNAKTTVRVDVGGSNEAYISVSGDYSQNRKLAFKWKVNDFALWIDGSEVGTDTSGSSIGAGILNSLQFTWGAGGNFTNGKIKQLQIYKTALTDAQLTSLTS